MVFYTIGIYLFNACLHIGSFFSDKLKKLVTGQKSTIQRFKTSPEPFPGQKLVWMHCASLGEFEQGRMVLELLKKNRPDIKIALSFFSPSGYEMRKNWPGADIIFYFPPDIPGYANRLIEWLKPDICLLVKYDFWWNHLIRLQKNNIPVLLLAAHFEKDKYYFHKPFVSIMKSWKKIFTMRDESHDVLNSKGFTNVETAGDPRMDRVVSIRNKGINLSDELKQVLENSPSTYVYGSVYPIDMEIIKASIEKRKNSLHVIVPHDVEKSQMKLFQKQCNGKADIFSEGLQGQNTVIIDQIGILAGIYAYADYVYIGGGFGKGIHNILEPAVFGIPVIFGPNYSSFPEAEELIESKDCFTISNQNEYENVLKRLEEKFKDRTTKNELPEYFRKHAGASQKILEYILHHNFLQ